MKLLFVTPAVPSREGGGAARMLEQLRCLRGLGVKADLLSYSLSGGIPEETASLAGGVWLWRPEEGPAVRVGNLLRFRAYPRHAGFAALLKERLSAGRYDLVHAHKFQMAGYLAGLKSPPVVVDLWACGLGGAWRDFAGERNPLEKAVKLARIPRFYAADRDLYPRFPSYFVVSGEAERYILDRYPGKRVYVMPHGVTLPAGPPAYCRDGHLVFVGDMSFSPNIEAVRFFCERVLPGLRKLRPGLKFYIVGKDPAPEALALARIPGAVVTGAVPEVSTCLAGASVFVAPIFGGLGLRTKLLEAFAHGLPVVTTTRACEGIPVSDGKDVLLAESADDFRDRTEWVLAHPDQAADIGGRARELVAREFSRTAIAARMKRAYDEILGGRNLKG